MRDLTRPLLPVIIIISIFATSVIIPANCLARYEICKQETFGDPVDDPHTSVEPLPGAENSETQATSNEITDKINGASIFTIYMQIVFNQLSELIY